MNSIEHKQIIYYMKLALEEAQSGFLADEVPVGAIIVSKHGELLASSFNLKEKSQDVTGHAEIIALKEAAKRIGSWRLEGASIFVTLEPCIMCMSAIGQSRIKNLYFGAYDKKGGALSLGMNINDNKKLNHAFNVCGGIKHYECSKIISDFFKQKRKTYKA